MIRLSSLQDLDKRANKHFGSLNMPSYMTSHVFRLKLETQSRIRKIHKKDDRTL